MGDTEPEERGDRSDADAPWRPGFEGWRSGDGTGSPDGLSLLADGDRDDRWSREHDQRSPEPWHPEPRSRRPAPRPAAPPGRPVATVDDQPERAVTGQVVLVGIVVAAMLLTSVVVAVAIRPEAQETSGSVIAPLIPETAEARWFVDLEMVVDEIGVGNETIVVTIREESRLVAFDLATGTELWQRGSDLPARGSDRIAVIGDRVVVQRRGSAGVTGVTVFDRLTGDEVWTADDATYAIRGTAERPMLVRLVRDDDGSILEVVDPVDGSTVGVPVPLSPVSVAGDDVLAQRLPNERVAVWSFDEMAPITGSVSAFNLRTVAEVDGVVVALDLERRIIAFDVAGERADERLFESDAFGEFEGRAELAGVVPGSGIGIIASGSSLGFAVDEGQIEIVWTRAGRAFAPVETERGPVSVLVGPDGEGGEINDTLIDARSGETLVVTDAGSTREQEPILGHNGYIATPEIGAETRRLEAIGYDGKPLWELIIPPSAIYLVAGGVVLVVDRRRDDSTITIVG